MEDITTRLQRARKNAGFETASDAARRFGWNENTYRSHENGERGIKSKIAEKYALALKVDIRWLLIGDVENPFIGQRLFAADGSILGGGVISDDVKLPHKDQNEYYRIWISFEVPEGTKSFIIADDRLMPRYDRNDLLLFWGPPRTDMIKYPAFHQEGIAWDHEGKRYFGHLSHDGTAFTVQCVNARPKHGLSIERFDVVQAIVRSATRSGESIVREEDQT